VRFVPGEPQNFKITYASDVGLADQFLRTGRPAPRRRPRQP
jgi:2-C-methyl-D-erythritol 4-phosphate cytidylyltransferase